MILTPYNETFLLIFNHEIFDTDEIKMLVKEDSNETIESNS
jgi:hypothetical protein